MGKETLFWHVSLYIHWEFGKCTFLTYWNHSVYFSPERLRMYKNNNGRPFIKRNKIALLTFLLGIHFCFQMTCKKVLIPNHIDLPFFKKSTRFRFWHFRIQVILFILHRNGWPSIKRNKMKLLTFLLGIHSLLWPLGASFISSNYNNNNKSSNNIINNNNKRLLPKIYVSSNFFSLLVQKIVVHPSFPY